MSINKTLELSVGLFIALGLVALFILAMKVSDISSLGDEKGYKVTAHFEDVGGLKVRSPIAMAGVRIGRVTAIDIDKQTYEAVVQLSLSRQYQLPEDTSASILTAGLLGEQYVGLEPGGSERYLKPGERIKLTQSAFVLERLIGRFLTSTADSNE